MGKFIRCFFKTAPFLLLLGCFFIPGTKADAQPDGNQPTIVVLEANGPLSPALDEYIRRGIQIAGDKQAELIIIELDTPGGSIDLMNQIVQTIRGSSIPIVVYVSPPGAIAGSAGTIITLSGHISAMAPETAIGAASPVGSQGEDIGETMESKTKEILKASVRTLMEKRSSEAVRLAEETIDSAKALSVEEAVEHGLVDLQAADIDDLLEKLDGREIEIGGNAIEIHTSGASIFQVKLTFIEELLLMLTNPNIVFLLLSIGIQAIFIELSSPGGWIAGFIGVVCLLLATYGLGILPINWFGLLFLIVAFVLFLLDIKAPTHGALTAAGAGSFIIGSLILFNSQKVPSYSEVSVPLVVATGVFLALTFFIIMTFAIRAQKAPIITGRESMIGQTGLARTDIVDIDGQVQVAGELWSAELYEGEKSIPADSRIEVMGVRGIHLIVRRLIHEKNESR